ncbi:hypothetical protein Acr_28g0004820 [Actinidia rufa]|uniref:Retrotransposon gag domain-containing protein n=1 Tax=Actinidia rufa TaxID=165716 RepID=A0A7J0H9J5_9ERIC|nr:hypothetical protein Acr_28g0004820 [Actinidia rufa]
MPYGECTVNVGDMVEIESQGHLDEPYLKRVPRGPKGEKNAQEELGELNRDQASLFPMHGEVSSFDGLGDPVVASHWLSQMHKIFDTVRIIEDDMKVSFASYQLVGEANEWWESIKEAKGVDRGMTWANFESTFEDQYFSEAYRDEFRDQFEKLVQKDMTVSEYAIKF